MRDAVRDGMIINVLSNLTCTTPKVQIKGISSELRRRVRSGDTRTRVLLHEAALRSTRVVKAKAKFIMTHFLNEMRTLTPFKGKAMVCCRSRKAVRLFVEALRHQISKIRKKFKKNNGKKMCKWGVYGAFSGELIVEEEVFEEEEEEDEEMKLNEE